MTHWIAEVGFPIADTATKGSAEVATIEHWNARGRQEVK